MLLDSWAWIEYLRGSQAGRKVDRMIRDTPLIYTSPIVLAEIWSKTHRTSGAEKAQIATQAILATSAMIDITESIGLVAGRIHAEMKKERPTFGMTDALILASARDRGVKVLTGDPHFEGLDDAILLEGNP